jgi:hypothetical protein
MKIRIKGNSVRLRLTRTDVDQFGKEGYIEERTEFGSNVFVYAMQRSDETSLTASFDGGKIVLLVPNAVAQQWTSTEQVGFSNKMNLVGDKELFLLVEKDFKCLDETIEDQSDNYDNPLMNK